MTPVRLLVASILATASVASGLSAPSNGTDDASLFWGTYRPNLYFGLKPRLPQSLMTGLMWFGLYDFQGFSQMRHSCEQGDGLAGYTWTEHDLREGGVQILKDPKNNIEITTELLKFPGGEHGGSWAARIKGRPMNPSFPSKVSMVFYVGIEGLGSLEMSSEHTSDGIDTEEIEIYGSTLDLGEFKMRFVDDPSSQIIDHGKGAEEFRRRLGKTHFAARAVPSGSMWRAKEVVSRAIVDFAQPLLSKHQEAPPADPAFYLSLPDDIRPGSNLYAIQKSFDGAFSFDVYYESGSANHKLDAHTFSTRIESFRQTFSNRFREVFPVPESLSPAHEDFSKAITSNLFGGIGYFYGTSIVDGYALEHREEEEEEEEEEYVSDTQIKQRARPIVAPPQGLLTATPSRPFFPRGFYWDEGFHLMLVGAWDNDLGLEILKSWVDLIDEEGWVGREQILGEEARSKVPEEFQMQFPTYANPPTLTMAVTSFIARLRERSAGDPLADQMGFQSPGQATFSTSLSGLSSSNRLLEPEAARQYLLGIYPSLRRHYNWFRRTQKGQIRQWAGRKARSRSEGYRWRGRTEQHVLTSGLDDYPRGPPHVGELHVDLISWVGFFSRTMREIAEFLEEREDEGEFRKIENDIIGNIDDLHWSNEEQMYCDANVDDDEESIHICHRGYVSLFPFLLELLPPNSPHLKPILDLIRDPKHLWSPYGIRSLSASHPQFGTDENYWRGPIWIQMNYLALGALKKTYAAEPGPYQELAQHIYKELRENIINNVFKEYQRTGYVWEQYDALTGEGLRSHPFTGWTSLVTLIISEKY